MAYAIVVNLDHERCSMETCERIWREVQDRMLESGYHLDGRTFVTNLPPDQACDLARTVMERVEDQLEYERHDLHRYLREFYGFPVEAKTNLLVPPLEDIEVTEVNMP